MTASLRHYGYARTPHLEIQASGLLIQKTARPGGTGTVGPVAAVTALFIKCDQPEGLAPHNQKAPHGMMKVTRGRNNGDPVVKLPAGLQYERG